MNRPKASSIILVALTLLVLHGCAGIYSVVEFEVLEPATVSFPDHVSQLVILNRAPFTLDAFQEEDRAEMEPEHLVMLDTLISNNTLRGLRSVLGESPIERFHTPFWLSERRTDTSSLDELILTKREVETICSKYGGDAIISLESYTLNIDEHHDYYKNAPGIIQNHYYEISNSITWNIHLRNSPRPFDTYSMVDTLFYSDILDGEFMTWTPPSTMIAELYYHSGSRYGRYLVPVWNHASRTLFKGKGDSLKLASKHTDRGEWEQAFDIWKALAGSSDSITSSKAYNNMAVYYELEDRLDSASYMLDRALESDSLELVKNYREELDIRLLNQKEVIEQVD
ncbi:MAG: DUF6340 family protein [Bacteroidota bacterium]